MGRTASDASLSAKIDSLHAAREKLTRIDEHDALTLLRMSLGHPRIVYTLRSGPAFDSAHLARYDDELRQCATECLNVRLDDSKWLQASLPCSKGGLGLSSLALPSFLAACSSVGELASKICAQAPDMATSRSRLETPRQSTNV